LIFTMTECVESLYTHSIIFRIALLVLPTVQHAPFRGFSEFWVSILRACSESRFATAAAADLRRL
jgi:hypothetical protein